VRARHQADELRDKAAKLQRQTDATRRGFYVKCDQDTNAGRTGLSLVVGLALTRPGEFVAFRFDHEAGECRVTELAWQPGLGLAG
jgi:hypothetical protein